LDQQAIPAFQRRWRSRHDEDYHDALPPQSEIATTERLFDNWFDPIEAGLGQRTREFLQAMFEAELDEVLARSRYARRARPASGDSEATPAATGHRHGHRSRSLLGTFGKVEIAMPRARLNTSDGKTTEWKSGALRAYQRRTLAADALIAGCYLAGTNTRRVRRALSALFGGAVGRQGHGEPGVAQSEERLGCVEWPLAG